MILVKFIPPTELSDLIFPIYKIQPTNLIINDPNVNKISIRVAFFFFITKIIYIFFFRKNRLKKFLIFFFYFK
jgi:hypothetical protein